MSNYQSRSDSLKSNLADLSFNDLPAMDIEKITALSSDSFKLTFTSNTKEAGEDQFAGAVSEYFNKKFSLISSTLQQIKAVKHIPMYSCVVAANIQSKEYDKKTLTKMKVVTANVFKDVEDNSIWNVVEVGSEKRLVQQSNDNLKQILQDRFTKMKTVAFFESISSFTTGEYVLFYNPISYRVESGYGIHTAKKACVVAHNSKKIYQVNPNSILAVTTVPSKAFDPVKLKTEADMTSQDATKLIDYYKKLYGDKPEFFKEFQKNIRDSVTQGPMRETKLESKVTKPEFHEANLDLSEIINSKAYKKLKASLDKSFKNARVTFSNIKDNNLIFHVNDEVGLTQKSLSGLVSNLSGLGYNDYNLSPHNVSEMVLSIPVKAKHFK